MCFSAGASFTGAAVLSAIGVATVRRAHDPAHRLFAGIPLFFSFQQGAEGVLWLTLKAGGNYEIQTLATYLFLIMALVVWPVMIPAAVMKMEEVPKKKKFISAILIAGITLSAYYVFCLLSFSVTPRINEFHIQYLNTFPRLPGYIAFGVYVVVTMGPLFLSSVKRMPLFGILMFLSCFVTGIFYKEYLTSVWCFFAALISVLVYVIIAENQKEYHSAGLRLLKLWSDHKPW